MQIIDASVLVKWFIDEEIASTTKSREIRDKFLNGNIKLVVPDLIFFEFANVLVCKNKITVSEMNSVWSLFIKYNIPVSPSSKIMIKSIKNARKYSISLYDSIYITLALEKSCDLITADKKLVEKVKLPFVKLI